jgi:hypothetical protein
MSGDSAPLDAMAESDDSGREAVDNKAVEPQKSERGARPRAIAPFELVALPEEERRLMLWLTRQKEATLDDILSGIAREEEETNLEDTLKDLLSSGLVEEFEVEGESLYRCQVRGQSGRRVSGMREDIWSRIDRQDSDRSDRT